MTLRRLIIQNAVYMLFFLSFNTISTHNLNNYSISGQSCAVFLFQCINVSSYMID